MANPVVLKSLTAEQQLIELVNLIQILESDETINIDNRDFVSGTYDSNTRIFTANIRIPCRTYVDPNSGLTGYTAQPYLTEDQ